ncbi:MAG: 4-phosphoerythronate dehydrogenase [Sedimentisphaerales bacterium]|nr:4-phosphoerythronate dehydrogenase [Sedimentisphaerales bacterium]
MRIVADENIPYVQELFQDLGQVDCLPGRCLRSDALRDADVLLVRSVTSVGADLLEGTGVRFVGTATIGTDHIDQEYLRSRRIVFVDAAGSNAVSVAEYVITAILVIAQQRGWPLAGRTLAVIGVGNIGSRVEAMARALDLRVLPNDPPRQRQTGDPRFVGLADALGADIITLHVPLTRGGSDPTWHMMDGQKLAGLARRAQTGRPPLLINSSRGGVVDNQALRQVLQGENPFGPVVLDVWENEPAIDPDLLARVDLATPHIAGYSLDGKANGTMMLYRGLCRFLDRPAGRSLESLLPAPPVGPLTIDSRGDIQQRLARALTAIYPIEADDRALRAIRDEPPEGRGAAFDRLRREYPVRREAGHYRIHLDPPHPELAERLRILGFPVD